LGGASIDFRNRSADDSWTYLINPRLRLAPNMIAYSRISTGYRPGGPNIGLPAASKPPTFGPDTVTSYEIGTKGDLLARRLSFDVAAFRIDWKDIQVTQQLNGFIYVVNGPKARSQGVEATFSLRPTKGLNVSLSGTYT
ncbi:TonB-dependent receptor domain-containing protein, partial [Proteus mirabilis]